MDAISETDLTIQLTRDMYYQVSHNLCGALAPLSDAPEDLARRDNAAIAQVGSLLPANADEANLAALYVAASGRALECLRLVNQYAEDAALARDFAAQADRMMRQARAFRSLLLRVQAARQKREADPAELGKAAWNEHCITGLMADALGRLPPARAMPEPPAAPEPPPAEPAPEPKREFSDMTEVEQYAAIYPRRAALIRSLGGLPAKCDFGPPEPELVRAIVASTSPMLRELDSPAAE
jgi:hypothetical protein